jgi:hypothetical protein
MTAAAWSRLSAVAAAHPSVVGLVLTGGRGKAVSTHLSDWDGLLVVADDAVARWRSAVPAGLDVSVVPASEWTTYAEPGTPYAWRAYDLAYLNASVDHGGFQKALQRKGRRSPALALEVASDAVGAALNHLYRAAKSSRDGDLGAARLDLAEMVAAFLEAVFALEGRYRPYNVLLAWELTQHPLRSVPSGVLGDLRRMLEGDLEAAWRVEAVLAAACQDAGVTDELDGWADHLAEVRST